MRFLLAAVNAKYIHSNPAVYSLRAYAGEDLQPHIDLAEYTINQEMQDILADIYNRRPDALGFSCYIWNWNRIRELLRELPKLLPDTDIWLGGPEVSFDAPGILKSFPQVKGVMVGEGEATFRELMQWYVDAEALPEQIPGLCLPSGYTPQRELLDLNKLPFLYAAGKAEESEAAGLLAPFANRIVYYESSRGCPYRCSYCLSAIDKRVRLREPETVKRELQFFLDKQVARVKFVDRTFNCDHGHAMAIWQYIHEHDNGVTNFHFEIEADILREDEIALLNRMRPGQVQLEIGVQSVHLKTLQAICRRTDLERLERAVADIHRGHNIHQHLDLIAGLPYENYESFARSFNRVYAMKPQQLQLGFLKVLKGAPIAQMADEFGIAYLDEPPYEVLYTNWLSYEEMLRLKRIEEMVERYYNSSQFTHTLPFLERVFDHPFAMYEALADYYEEQGFFVESPARAHRYELLLEFALKWDGANGDIYRELLTYDLYLRENMKSRPEFAGHLREQPEVKAFIREFFQREERERRFLPSYEGYDWKQLSRMTHLEPFRYTVWNPADITVCTHPADGTDRTDHADAGMQYVLFDYHDRSPLTGEARTQVIESCRI